MVGLGEEDFASLSPELTQKYEELFHQPETFMRLGRQMLVLPVPDENVRTETAKAKPRRCTNDEEIFLQRGWYCGKIQRSGRYLDRSQ